MPGFVPSEGETLIAQVIHQRTHVDRDANLELGIFTNVSPTKALTHAAITEPSGTGYARITLTDASWVVSGGAASYAQQTFTAGGAWTGAVQGYFICSKSAGGTKRLLYVEKDGLAPIAMGAGDTYKVTPGITDLSI